MNNDKIIKLFLNTGMTIIWHTDLTLSANKYTLAAVGLM